MKERYFFTFGSNHAHPNGYVVISAPDFSAARTRMHSLFGDKWAFQYPDDQETADMIARFRLYEAGSYAA